MIEDNSLNMSGLMKGDERAFQSLFIDYYPLLVSSAMKYVDEQEAAEGCVRESVGGA